MVMVHTAGGELGRGEIRGEIFAVKKSGGIPAPPSGEIFAACDQQFHCEFKCRRINPEPTRK